MSVDLKLLSDYMRALQKNLATGQATELSYYPALRVLVAVSYTHLTLPTN